MKRYPLVGITEGDRVVHAPRYRHKDYGAGTVESVVIHDEKVPTAHVRFDDGPERDILLSSLLIEDLDADRGATPPPLAEQRLEAVNRAKEQRDGKQVRCHGCGAMIERRSSRTRFCGDTCRRKYQRERSELEGKMRVLKRDGDRLKAAIRAEARKKREEEEKWRLEDEEIAAKSPPNVTKGDQAFPKDGPRT